MLYFTAATIAVTFIAVVWTICKDIIEQWIHPKVEDVRDGIYTNGIRFVSLDDGNEYVLTVTNIVTDMLCVHPYSSQGKLFPPPEGMC